MTRDIGVSLLFWVAIGAGVLRAASTPLPLPPNFDREVALLGGPVVDGRTYHSTTNSAQLAQELIENGAPTDLELAEKVLNAVLSCQERHPDDPHYGNFRWTYEEPQVEDLNAVQFVMMYLEPIMIEHKERVSPAMQTRLLESIRLGLEEIRRIDVNPAYTNIALMDISDSSLGGELLHDRRIAEQGYRKFVDWMKFTDRSGGTYEYNSATYTTVAIRVLSQLVKLVQDQETRIRAQVMLARVGLSAALHINPATGRWIGPHGRAYYPTVVGSGRAEIESIRDLIKQGDLPAWVSDILEPRDEPIQVIETTDAANGIGTSAYHGKSFSVGVAARELGNNANRFMGFQSNLFTIQYRRGEGLPGSVFSRYVLDDTWAGDYQITPSRARSEIPERGLFHGVQDSERAICLYTSPDLSGLTAHFSAKAVVAWPRWGAKDDEIWVGEKRIQSLPADVPRGSSVVLASGDVMIAIRPLTVSDLGRNAPIRLTKLDGNQTLVLEMYNYLGPRKAFWELSNPGTFYKGVPRNGFYSEVVERSAYPNGGAFAREIASGKLTDEAAEPFTYSEPLVYEGKTSRPWKVEYSRAGRSLGVETDLMHWAQAARRWTHQGELGQLMLESPVARESRSGQVRVGDATLECGKHPAWLVASPKSDRFVAAYHGPDAAPLTLKLPRGSVEIEAIGTGMVIWNNGQVVVEGLQLKGAPRVTGGRLVTK